MNNKGNIKSPVRLRDRKTVTRWNRRQRREDYAWLRLARWEFLCTFTFPQIVSDAQAIDVLKRFINHLERTLRCSVSLICSSEKRLSGCGRPACGRHFHLVMTCGISVSPTFIESLWTDMAGWPRADAGAKVDAYDP